MAPEPKTDIAQPVGISRQDTASAAHSATLDQILAGVSRPGAYQHKKRRAFAASAAVLAGCSFWFLTLSKVGASFEALPWYITVGIIGVLCAHRATLSVIARHTALESRFAGREPLSLLETWAIAYLISATALYACAMLQSLQPKKETARMTHFVDIRLVSPADFADRQSPLAGTQEAEDLHKRQSDKVTRRGSLSATKVAKVAQKSEPKPKETHGQLQRKEQDTKQAQPRDQKTPMKRMVALVRTPTGSLPSLQNVEAPDMVLIKPSSAGAPAAARSKQSTKGHAEGNQPLIEEVQPPELVEMIENDGAANSPNVFADGGHSQGGTGAPNDLTEYIKALHKRIKNLWSPPRGQPHRAAILFRIKHDGKLAFIKLVSSSGEYETDSAAVKAVTGSVTGHALPASYAPPYLDVQYTFNYSVDELKEVR